MRGQFTSSLMHFTFRQKSKIPNLYLPPVELSCQTLAMRSVRLTVSKIIDLMRIIKRIIKFYRRLGLPKSTLDIIKFTLIKHFFPNSSRIRLKHICNKLTIYLVRIIISNIFISFISYRTNHIIAFIHSASKSMNEFPRLFRVHS